MSGVAFGSDGGVATITLDNPPANSYDLAVMTAFADAVDQAIESDVRAVIVRSASEKFFSAGADVKKFLDGDVERQHGDDPHKPGRVHADGRGVTGVHRPHQRARARRRAGDRARLRPALRQQRLLQARHARR